jgi:hypothetical protein
MVPLPIPPSGSIHLPPDWLKGSAFIDSHYILPNAAVRTLNVAKIQGVSSKGCHSSSLLLIQNFYK